jgi:exonuclease III
MLNHFLHTQDIDIALLQEITTSNMDGILRYNVYMNRGSEGRGRAIITKEGLRATNILRLPTGRGMAAEINGTWIINLYAPSGAEKTGGERALISQMMFLS